MTAAPRRAPLLPPALVLFVAVAAMSYAGPLVRFATAPAPVIAAWRLTLSVLFILVVLALRPVSWRGVRLTRGEWLSAVLAGLLLAAHFWSWIASLDMTTVASSVVLVSTQPIFVAALSAVVLGEHATRRQWLGIGLGVLGAAIIGWGDFALGGRALLGDLLALLGAVFVSGYYIIGRRLRQRLDLWLYIALVYGVAALAFLLLGLLHPGVALTGWPTRDWLIFAALAAGPMMIGHTGMNYALRYVRAYTANLALLGEPIGATLIAWWLLAELPGGRTFAGAALIVTGVAVAVARGGGRANGDVIGRAGATGGAGGAG